MREKTIHAEETVRHCFSDLKWIKFRVWFELGFPGSSSGKESAFNEGDSSSIPGSGRSLEEGIATHSSIFGLSWWLRW